MILSWVEHQNVVTDVSVEAAVLEYVRIQIQYSLLVLRGTLLALVGVARVF